MLSCIVSYCMFICLIFKVLKIKLAHILPLHPIAIRTRAERTVELTETCIATPCKTRAIHTKYHVFRAARDKSEELVYLWK